MTENKKTFTRVIAVALIAFGVVLGVNWGSAKFCIGDHIFSALGLPVWSKGTSRAHYPAILGSVFLLAGISMFNFTLQKKPALDRDSSSAGRFGLKCEMSKRR